MNGIKTRLWQNMTATMVILAGTMASPLVLGQITFVVNSLGDDGQETASSGVLCFTGNTIPPQIPECTLRAAIESANDASEPVVIEFWSDIETLADRSQIDIESGLPFISNQVTIDGTTHPLYEGIGDTRLHIRYTGPASSTVSGLRFHSNGGGSGSTVRAIGILGFTGSGILLNGGNGYTIEHNHIGNAWQPAGTSGGRIGNHGIDVNGASDVGLGITLIRDNVIANTDGHGILIRSGARATIIYDNVIGLYQRGSTAFQPFQGAQIAGTGVFIASNAGNDNNIGLLGSNVIAYAQGGGIVVRANGQSITGNLIGLPPAFQPFFGYEVTDYGNGDAAVVLESSNNILGGAGTATNYIGNSPSMQVRIGNDGSTPFVANNNQVRRNLIGITPDADEVGGQWGIRIDNGDDTSIRNATIANHDTNITLRGSGNQVHRNTISNGLIGVEVLGTGNIGSADTNDANLIGGNEIGIQVKDTGPGPLRIRNNFIGVDEDGTDFGNEQGIVVSEPGNLVRIFENSIGFNDEGIYINQSASGTWVQGNDIGELDNGMPVPNEIGVRVRATFHHQETVDHLIGGSVSTDLTANPAMGNLIANSTQYGVLLEQLSSGNLKQVTVRGNTFRNNASGITYVPQMTQIDPGGALDGPNGYMNWPELVAVDTAYNEDTGQVEFTYQVNTTTANASYPLLVDFYIADGSSRQGRVFLHTDEYTGAFAAQPKSGSFVPPAGVDLQGAYLVATATDSDGNTSQFSEAILLTDPVDEIFQDRFEEVQ